MREYETVVVEEIKEMEKSITCNKCGGKVDIVEQDGFEGSHFQNFVCHFHYGSKFDTEAWEFDLCEKCLVGFIRTFAHLPEGYDKEYADKVYKENSF